MPWICQWGLLYKVLKYAIRGGDRSMVIMMVRVTEHYALEPNNYPRVVANLI